MISDAMYKGLLILCAGLIAVEVLWIYYLSVMALKRARDSEKLTFWGKVFGYPVLLTGYALDILENFVIMTVILMEPPHEFLITSRLIRHINGTDRGWRYKVCTWFCANLLDPFDPSGCHCTKEEKLL